jgi:D-proline reductase (dithiol) PrdB
MTDPVEYIRITRERYEKAGFEPYRWYHSDTPPSWTGMTKPLSECRIGVVVSAGAYVAGQVAFYYKDDASLRRIPKTTEARDLRFAHVTAYMLDDARKDPNCLLPVDALRRLEAEGFVGGVADTIYACMGGIYSQRKARETVIPALLDAMRAEQVDAVFLVAFCPVCHQTLSLAARSMEEAGLPTLFLGSALDIVKAVNPPRTVFLDYPLGHSAGKPFDREDQYGVVRAALGHLETIDRPGTVVTLPNQWDDPNWRQAAYNQMEDKREPRDETPRYQTEEDRVLAERNLAGSGAAD